MRLYLIAALLTTSAYASDVNKDVRNLGPAAHGLAVVLSGTETVTGHYDGYPSGHFNSFASGPLANNTLLNWTHFVDGNNMIDPNQVIHVGWTTPDQSSVFDMYWTNISGGRIPGSIVYNITSGWSYDGTRHICNATWHNAYARPASVSFANIRFALRTTPYPLAQLNGQNGELMQSLQSLGSPATLPPGQAMSRAIPGSQGMNVIVVYDVSAAAPAPGSAATSTDFVQFRCP